MRRLIASEFVTLDGVMEAPGHEQHRDGKHAWALRSARPDQQRDKAEELLAAGAVLLGRVTDELFAVFWPMAPNEEGLAERRPSPGPRAAAILASGTDRRPRPGHGVVHRHRWIDPASSRARRSAMAPAPGST